MADAKTQPQRQENFGDILSSFGRGAAEGPWESIKSVPEGVSALWKIIKAIPNPQARQQMIDAYNRMTPTERQAVVDGVHEAAGAAVGGFGGGVLGTGAGPLGTAAGAVVGAGAGGAAGRFLSRLWGHVVNPEGVQESGAKEAEDYGKALTGGATLEGAGRSLGVMARALKGATLTPTTQAASTAAKAKAMGVPQSVGVATGRVLPQKIEAALAKYPFSAEFMAQARKRAQDAFESNIQKFLEGYRQGEVTPEAFQTAIGDALDNARTVFQSELGNQVNTAAGRFGKARTAMQAGEDLQKGLLDNEAIFSGWKGKAYPELYEAANTAGVQVNPTEFSQAAQALKDTLPEELWGFFSPATQKRLRTAVELRPEVMVDTPNGTVAQRIGEADPLLLQEAVEMRTQIYDTLRRMPRTAAPKDREVLYGLARAVDGAIENSVKATDPDIYARWRLLSEQFKKGFNAINEPVRPGKPGNPMARKVRDTKEPEKIVNQATDNSSRVGQAELATNPDTITRAVDPALNTVSPRPPMDSVRRNVFDRIVDKSSSKKGRISPADLDSAMSDPGKAELYETLFGDRTADFRGQMKGAIPREGELYDTSIAKALDSTDPSSRKIMNSAFPANNRSAARQSLDILDDPGYGERAFAEDLANRSKKVGMVNKNTGDAVSSLLDPNAMTKRLEAAGETAEEVLGKPGKKQLQDILEVGRSTFAPDYIHGNHSNTAPTAEMFRIGRKIIGVPALLAGGKFLAGASGLGGAAAAITVPKIAARVMNSPRVVDWAMKAPRATEPLSKGAVAAHALDGVGATPEKPITTKPEKDEAIHEEPLDEQIAEEPMIEEPVVPMARNRKRK